MNTDAISTPVRATIAAAISSQLVPYCWLASVLTHAMLVGAALVLLAELELKLPPPTFRWDVAVVDAPAPQATPAPEAPPPPAPVQQPAPVTKPPVPVKPVTKPVVEATQRPVEQNTVQPVAQQVTQVPTEVVQESLISTEPATQTPTEVLRESLISTQPVTQTEVHRVETSVQATPTEVTPTEAMSEPVQQAVVSPTVASLQEPTVTTATPTEQPAMTSDVPIVEQVMRRETPAITPAVQHRTVRQMQMRSVPQTRPDYGWLAQTLFERVERHKDYPRQARLNHWEGRVILHLTIEQRGSSVYLLNAGIAETSGHAVLDQYTLEMVQKVFPLGVKHSLGQPEVLLHLPFTYRLD